MCIRDRRRSDSHVGSGAGEMGRRRDALHWAHVERGGHPVVSGRTRRLHVVLRRPNRVRVGRAHARQARAASQDARRRRQRHVVEQTRQLHGRHGRRLAFDQLGDVHERVGRPSSVRARRETRARGRMTTSRPVASSVASRPKDPSPSVVSSHDSSPHLRHHPTSVVPRPHSPPHRIVAST